MLASRVHGRQTFGIGIPRREWRLPEAERAANKGALFKYRLFPNVRKDTVVCTSCVSVSVYQLIAARRLAPVLSERTTDTDRRGSHLCATNRTPKRTQPSGSTVNVSRERARRLDSPLQVNKQTNEDLG